MQKQSALPLPELHLDEQHATEQVKQLIIKEIEHSQSGYISFAAYMQIALYAPRSGYYTSNKIKFGTQGDFITAPLIGRGFATCLASQCQSILANIPNGQILEVGAGQGQLALDILTYFKTQNLPIPHYNILELSAPLTALQQQTLDSFSNISWLQALPKNFQGVIIANEVIDALPVHLIKNHEGCLKEQCVQYRNNTLDWHLAPLTRETQQYLHETQLDTVLSGYSNYQTEICPLLKPWVKSLQDCLQQGVILLIDYGFPRKQYYHPTRETGTLMCHFKHRAGHLPLQYPGLQDLTAHVDFTTVAEAAYEEGVDILGYTTLSHFLVNCGLLDKLLAIYPSHSTPYSLQQEVNTLTCPSEMGELFKVIALGKKFNLALEGFSYKDQLARL